MNAGETTTQERLESPEPARVISGTQESENVERTGLLRRSWSPLRRSLSLRIALTIAVVLALIFAFFALWISTELRTDLFQMRRNAVIEDASLRFSQAQSVLDQSTADTPDQVQEVTSQLLSSIRESAEGAGVVGINLMRSPQASSTFRINEYVTPDVADVITPEMRAALKHDFGSWQSVAYLPTDGQGRQPGILVGALVDLPAAGPHQMFILYSLQTEQAAVNTVMSVLFFGFVPILVAMTGLTFFLVFRMLRPVRAAAAAATRLAEGDLDSRVETGGQDEMALLGRAFNNMAESLEEQITEYDKLSQLQQRFVSDVSHELRTPMTTIRMAEDIIFEGRDSLEPVERRSAELLHSQVERLEEMLADLLEISRYDAKSATPDLETTDLYALTTRVIGANQGLADQLGVDVQLSPRPKKPTAPVDTKRIERVIRNLLVNAYEYADGGRVVVTVESGETSVAIRVRDFGMGMSRDTVKRVFDRFYRADPARTRTTGGTGLGLAIAKEDVDLHNGVINVWGEQGKGSSFVVTLPKEPLSAVTEFPLILWEQQ